MPVYKLTYFDAAASRGEECRLALHVAGNRTLSARLPRAVEPSGLTRREIEILQLVSEGYSNAQVAQMLWVTEQTVKFHLSNIYRKLDVANRTEASRWAQLHDLLPRMMPAVART